MLQLPHLGVVRVREQRAFIQVWIASQALVAHRSKRRDACVLKLRDDFFGASGDRPLGYQRLELVQRHADIFARDYLDSVRPFPGVAELFERLRADGVRIALASSARKWERDRYIARLGVGHLLDAATTGRSAKHTKPQPDVFRAALARLGGVARDEAVVVGDSPYDAQAARRGGMQAIGVLTGGFPKQRLWEAGARMVFRDIEDLLESYEASPFAEARQLVA